MYANSSHFSNRHKELQRLFNLIVSNPYADVDNLREQAELGRVVHSTWVCAKGDCPLSALFHLREHGVNGKANQYGTFISDEAIEDLLDTEYGVERQRIKDFVYCYDLAVSTLAYSSFYKNEHGTTLNERRTANALVLDLLNNRFGGE